MEQKCSIDGCPNNYDIHVIHAIKGYNINKEYCEQHFDELTAMRFHFTREYCEEHFMKMLDDHLAHQNTN